MSTNEKLIYGWAMHLLQVGSPQVWETWAQGWIQGWKTDERSKHVAWPAPQVRWREASPREQRQGSVNFLEFIKHANYPEKPAED